MRLGHAHPAGDLAGTGVDDHELVGAVDADQQPHAVPGEGQAMGRAADLDLGADLIVAGVDDADHAGAVAGDVDRAAVVADRKPVGAGSHRDGPEHGLSGGVDHRHGVVLEEAHVELGWRRRAGRAGRAVAGRQPGHDEQQRKAWRKAPQAAGIAEND